MVFGVASPAVKYHGSPQRRVCLQFCLMRDGTVDFCISLLASVLCAAMVLGNSSGKFWEGLVRLNLGASLCGPCCHVEPPPTQKKP